MRSDTASPESLTGSHTLAAAGIVELVRFRLTAGTTDDDFLARATATQGLVAAKPGFIRRALLQDAAGHWTDLVEWQSQMSAMQAAETLMQDAGFADFCACIDMTSVEMQHLPIVARLVD